MSDNVGCLFIFSPLASGTNLQPYARIICSGTVSERRIWQVNIEHFIIRSGYPDLV